MQAQGDTPRHGVAGHQVQLGKVRYQLQDCPYLDILEVQRDAITHVGELVLAFFHLLCRQWLDAEHILVVGLVSQVVEVAGGFERQGSAALGSLDVYGVHRCRKVGDLVASHQPLGHVGVKEFHIDIPGLAEHVDVNRRISQVQGQPALAIPRALELEISNFGYDLRHLVYPAGQGVRIGGLLGVLLRALLAHDQIQVIAVHPGAVGHQLDQVDNHPGAITGLQHQYTRGVTVGQGESFAVQAAGGIGEVDRNAGRLLDRIGFHVRWRLIELNPNFELAPTRKPSSTSGSPQQYASLFPSGLFLSPRPLSPDFVF